MILSPKSVPVPACGVWELDPLADRVHYTPAFKRQLGLPHEHEHDPTAWWRSRVHPEDLQPMKDALFAHLAGRHDEYRMSFRLRDGAGHWRWVLSCGRVSARDASGQALRMLGTLTDLSAFEAQALERARDEIVQRAQHDLRTPLNAVLGFAQLLAAQLGHGDTDSQRRHVAAIEQGGWQLLDRIERLLAGAQPAGGAARCSAPE
jgi:signal transduction histidine kinase